MAFVCPRCFESAWAQKCAHPTQVLRHRDALEAKYPRMFQRGQLLSLQEEVEIECPYCGEQITLLIDGSSGSQEYIEDCQVCCRPITLNVTANEDGLPQVEVRRDDE